MAKKLTIEVGNDYMREIEAIQTSIHLNLLLAKNNMKEERLELAVHRVEDARILLEQLEILISHADMNQTNTL